MKHGEGVIGSRAEGRIPKGVPQTDPRVSGSSPVRPVHHNRENGITNKKRDC
jgi:hypothetical protein